MRTLNCHNTVVFLPFCALVLFDPARRLQIQEHQWNFRNQISAIWLHKPFTFTQHLLQAKKGSTERTPYGLQVRSPARPSLPFSGTIGNPLQVLPPEGCAESPSPHIVDRGQLRSAPPFPPAPRAPGLRQTFL